MKHVMVVSHECAGTALTINTIAKNWDYPETFRNLPRSAVHGNVAGWLDSLPDNQIIKTHYAWHLMAPHWEAICDHCHVFYVCRSGADLLLSLWEYARYRKWIRLDIQLSEFIRLAVPDLNPSFWGDGLVLPTAQRWARHMSQWAPQTGVTLVSYEDLVNELDVGIREIVSVLGPCPTPYKRATTKDDLCERPGPGIVGRGSEAMSISDLTYINDMRALEGVPSYV